MANLDETGTPPGDDGRNGEPHDASPAAGGPSRLQELERENARLRDELHALRQTLRAVAPAWFVSEEEMREDIAAAVPAERLMAELEQRIGGQDAA